MNNLTIIKEIVKGKSLSRTLTNIELKNFKPAGKILDIGGQKGESQYRFLDIKNSDIKTLNIERKFNPDYVADLEKDSLPLEDLSLDWVFCFNVLEHIYNEKKLLKEAYRILKTNGFFLGSVPFLVNVHPDPHDYKRFTKEALKIILKEAGFNDISIKPVSRGPYTAAYSQIEFTIPAILRPMFCFPCFLLDRILSLLKPGLKQGEKFVLAYIFSAKK